jgi:tRNA-guanine family transglycosylase
VIDEAGGLHNYMRWPHALLTDSGGFQMVSLSKLMTVTEQHVTFTNPYEPTKAIDLSPEDCIRVQQQIGK